MSTALDSRLVGFARALRGHGVILGTSEIVDAGAAVRVLGLDDRGRLREGLAAALLRRSGQRQVFDDLYDVWFPAALGERSGVSADAPPGTLEDRRSRAAELRDDLARALAAGDEQALDELAARVVAELGALANAATTGSFSAQQALDTLAPQTAIVGALQRLQDAAEDAPGGSGDGSGGSGGSGSGVGGPASGNTFASRFTRDEVRAGVAAFRRRVEAETRRRNAEVRGPERISRYAVRPPAEQTPFLLAGPAELEELRGAIQPLARKLATRLAARQRRASRGRIDVRRTLRRSLSTGGIPIRPALEHASPHRPDLVILCDLSTSVAGFSRFTILLVQALATQFRRVRILGFVNRVDDLTEQVIGAPPGSDLGDAFDDLSRMTRWHRNSDYGAVLTDVVEHHLDVIGHRTAVLILGDARSNHTDPQFDALREIAAHARHVSWLNPEPVRMWGSSDSVALRYSEIVDMHECRNVAQLREFVSRLLPV
ncbi:MULTISPECIES: VWA domain-containing protein [unclassified Knoellia]|uniref:VWA domain-containing protein n=1 Tax=Knoellia altitudinis TaxID=3404795 RepID=UPI00360E452C